MKIKPRTQKELGDKLLAIEEAIETALTDNFIKEQAFDLLHEAMTWTRECRDILRV